MTDMTLKFKKFSLDDLLKNWPELLKSSQNLSESELQTEITQVSSIAAPLANSIVFMSEGLNINLEFKSENSADDATDNQSNIPKAMVLPLNASEELLAQLKSKKIISLLSPNPKLAMAFVSDRYFAEPRINNHFKFSDSDIHPSAVIHESAKIGQNVKIGPNVVIGKNSELKDFCKIGSNSVIEEDVTLGEHCQIYPNVTISWGSILGDHCWIQSNTCIGSDGFGYATNQVGQHYAIPHIGRVRMGQHVHIGAGTQIDRGTFGETYIGDFTKIDNLVHIAHNCKIGKSCLITGGFMVAGSTEIGNFFACGGRTTMNGHIKVADHVQAAGMSVIQKSVPESGKYGGYPLMPLSQHLKVSATFTKLFDFRKDLNRVMKHLNLNKD
jgi:UDP-3-O-[3-hydroxymyristoyl] glucosamine N-acyltransferase